MNYPRGSQWRKWDLHAHTPIDHEWINKPDLSSEDSKKEFARKYINFAKKQNLDVIGITNHNFCNDLDSLLIPYIQKEAADKNITILPGFEITASDGSGIHLLVLFSENTPLNEIKSIIDQCFPPNTNLCPEDGQIPVSNKNVNEIKEVIDESGKDAIFIFAHADSENGVLDPSTIRGTRRVQEWKKKFINIAQISKSPQDYAKDSFMYNVINKKDNNYNRDMTYVIASDCRAVEELEDEESRHYLGEKFTWIKADPTFEGLKQIIYEPDRVKIQQHDPYKSNKKLYINDFSIKNNNSFLIDSQKIPFNRDLVSVIGGKGSGKSILLSLLSFLNCDIDKSFIDIFEEEDVSLEFNICDKNLNEISVDKILDYVRCDSDNYPIYYIKQGQLAKEAGNEKNVRKRLLEEIGLDEIGLEYDSCLSVANDNLELIKDRKNKVEKIKEDLNFENDRKENENLINFIRRKIKGAKDKKKKFSNEEIQESIKSISEIIKKGTKLKKWEESDYTNKIKDKLRSLTEVINEFRDSSLELLEDIEIKNINIPEPVNEQKFIEDYIKVKEEFKNTRDNLREELLEIKNKLKLEKEVNDDIPSLLSALEDSQEEITKLEQYEKDVEKAKKDVSDAYEKLSSLFVALEEDQNNTTVSGAIKKRKGVIENRYKEFKKESKSELFDVIFEGVVVEARIKLYWKELKKDLLDCFYKDHINNIEKEIFDGSKQSLNNLFSWVSSGDIWKFIDDNRDSFKAGSSDSYQREGLNNLLDIIFMNWFEYIKVEPKIKMEGKELESMSIGEQATLLLRLKLATEGIKNQIIIIDQPEDNLDNKFITDRDKGLIPLIKKIKDYRQIIIATHNANLVVGSDSEQVIISNLDKTGDKKYLAGSLENKKIYDTVCKILEGGKSAFENRRKKYRIKNET